jgi:hypothetical protein
MPGTLYTFKSLTHYGKVTISEQLEVNLTSFFNWGLLEVGAFTNVRIPNTTIRGGEAPYKLRPVVDPNFANGRVWESQRCNWVYESGLNYSTQPIYHSGVFVNGVFKNTAASGFAHYVDYPNGRIVFDTAISPSSTVTCEYSYKRVKVTDIDDPLFRLIQERSFHTDDANIPSGNGEWARLASSRLQLPIVAVEIMADCSFSPKMIGGGQYKHQEVAFHVIADTALERNKLCDIIAAEKERTLLLFDINKIANANSFALLSNGNLNPSGVNNYRNMLLPVESGGYQWKLCNFETSSVRQVFTKNPNLFYGLTTIGTKVDMPEL